MLHNTPAKHVDRREVDLLGTVLDLQSADDVCKA